MMAWLKALGLVPHSAFRIEQRSMHAMLLERRGEPLRWGSLADRPAGPYDLVIDVRACGVCRTDLHVFDGDLPDPALPLVLGHEIVGVVVERGDAIEEFQVGDRVGVPWLGFACGTCRYCRSDRENLCVNARFTGYQYNGGYAERTMADGRFVFAIPERYADVDAAPLLCAGLIGYRAYRKAGEARRLGLYGFGGAAHIVAQVAVFERRDVFAFTRPGDRRAQDFARSLGAVWAGDSTEPPPELLDAAIIFASVGALVPAALRHVAPGGVVVCAGIHMSPIPEFPYEWLWGERTVCSVANLTRRDGREFLELAPRVPVRTETIRFPLAQANEALSQLRSGAFQGAAVLVP
jgi:propanol-preferring alcohol dehydrogenase